MEDQNSAQIPPVNPTPTVVEIVPPQTDPQQAPPSGKFSISPKVMLIILAILIIAVVGSGMYLSAGSQPKQVTKSTPTPLPTEAKAPAGDPTASWKAYIGKYYSFKYPSNWTIENGPAESTQRHLETVNLRGSPIVTFSASAESEDYQKAINFAETSNSPTIESVTIGSKAGTQLSYKPGDVIAYPMTNIYIKTNDGIVSYYLIAYSTGDSQATREINQILSTFKFTDATVSATPTSAF